MMQSPCVGAAVAVGVRKSAIAMSSVVVIRVCLLFSATTRCFRRCLYLNASVVYVTAAKKLRNSHST